MSALTRPPLSMIAEFFVPLALIDYLILGAQLWRLRSGSVVSGESNASWRVGVSFSRGTLPLMIRFIVDRPFGPRFPSGAQGIGTGEKPRPIDSIRGR